MPRSTHLLTAGLGLWIALAMSATPSRAAEPGAGPPQATPARAAPASSPGVQRLSRTARLADVAELRDIEKRGRETVAALVQRMHALPDGPQRHALQAEVLQVKRDTRVQFLGALARHARARGDAATVRAAEQQINLLVNPRRAATPAGTIQPLVKPVPEKGGRP